MFRFLVALSLAIVSMTAWAQVVDDGVVESIDEFTAVRTCWQRVHNSVDDRTGIWMTLDEEDGWTVFTYIVRATANQGSSAFSLLGTIGAERVYVRFDEGDVLELQPAYVERDLTREVAGFMDNALAARLMSAPADVRVRFDGPNGRVDFTIDHGVAVALAAGFGKTCYPQ